MIANEPLTNEIKPGFDQEQTGIQRRTLIGGAFASLLSSSGQVMADENGMPSDPFILLLKGIYQPVHPGHGPNLGLTTVNLNDGSYFSTQIYPVLGLSDITGQNNHDDQAIGTFYVQLLSGNLCAYRLPGGAIAMQFTSQNINSHSDGHGGAYLSGTYELTILEATGIYRAFKGGHNHMVARTHQLANNNIDEFCFCIISQYLFP